MLQPLSTITAFIALGSNLGDRNKNIHSALTLIRELPGVSIENISSLMEFAAVGGPPDSGPFLNAVAQIKTILAPLDLLDRLLEIERQLGRVRRTKWEPRIIDLDLLLHGDQIIDQPRLTIPHPLMHQRRFVLEPLAQIAPDALHPIMGKMVSQLLAELPPDLPTVA